jgi:hypothetical protein
MKVYLNGPDTVKKLHERGFTDDFHLTGNDLLWVQEKCLIRVGEFVILEYHKIIEPKIVPINLLFLASLPPIIMLKGF